MNTIILNIDASTASLYMSICKNGIVLAELQDENQKNQSSNVQPFAEKLLNITKLQWADVHAIAVMNGPGSYTGLRISLAAAKGYCFALDIPLITISNLASIAYSYFFNNNTINKNIICAISPMQNELIIGTYSADLQLQNKEEHIKILDVDNNKKLANNIVVGDFTTDTIENFNISNFSKIAVNKQNINAISLQYFNNQYFTNIVTAEPNYIKDTFIL